MSEVKKIISEKNAEIARLCKRVEKLERFTEILRTLLDKNASMEEFKAAVKAVTG